MKHPTTSLRDAAETPPVERLLVVRGDATPEEIAALVAVLATRGGGVAPEERRSAWSRPQPRRALPAPGPGAWQAAVR